MTARTQSDPIGNALDSMATTSVTAISDQQRKKAVAAVVWRYQQEGWTAGEPVEVLEASGLAGEDRPRRLRKGW